MNNSAFTERCAYPIFVDEKGGFTPAVGQEGRRTNPHIHGTTLDLQSIGGYSHRKSLERKR
ncbi:MAG: hypothetical protein D8M57_04495 [Candidatus Scalindua sp. AMX11]|nr:MAG: hypothetical protein DWQ00_04100 [Candidatus Scalindua sp.]NOG84625.1 hypothetical protein [Planctomycetota bacterium]RZV92398.1 MAG: hypothetical protein EX341_04950 [Candidatus Scalindua sp. SCAELEC01]TDE66076.1 MAG: hypothetical protein D8M57_04495 [Candidatus Scalindua sp. AMX11]GJQ59048.1 MAG: hypothetical protein SCALA701_18490 [Candidatus Scalindua sp.]